MGWRGEAKKLNRKKEVLRDEARKKFWRGRLHHRGAIREHHLAGVQGKLAQSESSTPRAVIVVTICL